MRYWLTIYYFKVKLTIFIIFIFNIDFNFVWIKFKIITYIMCIIKTTITVRTWNNFSDIIISMFFCIMWCIISINTYMIIIYTIIFIISFIFLFWIFRRYYHNILSKCVSVVWCYRFDINKITTWYNFALTNFYIFSWHNLSRFSNCILSKIICIKIFWSICLIVWLLI